jgi:hypothetical protein
MGDPHSFAPITGRNIDGYLMTVQRYGLKLGGCMRKIGRPVRVKIFRN